MKRLWSVLLHLFAAVGVLAVVFVVDLVITMNQSRDPIRIALVAPVPKPRAPLQDHVPNACSLVQVNELPEPGSKQDDAFLYLRFTSLSHEGIVYLSPTKKCRFRSPHEEDEFCAETVAYRDGEQDHLLGLQISMAFAQQTKAFTLSDFSEHEQKQFLRFFEEVEIRQLFKERFHQDPCILAEYLNTALLPRANEPLPVFLPDRDTPIAL